MTMIVVALGGVHLALVLGNFMWWRWPAHADMWPHMPFNWRLFIAWPPLYFRWLDSRTIRRENAEMQMQIANAMGEITDIVLARIHADLERADRGEL